MKPDSRFITQPKHFWANVRSISQYVGYTARGEGRILVPSIADIARSLASAELGTDHVIDRTGKPTDFGRTLASYFDYRADVLNRRVEPLLMDAERAAAAFERVLKNTRSRRAVTMNKQKGEKKKPAYLTAIVNMIIEQEIEGLPCDYDPRQLTTFTSNNSPLRTLARRFDGAFPSTTNPIAVWEVKEYYHTTTFGSRVADGVYETLLDGMELEELQHAEGIECQHCLMLDAHYTWWECGRSYLCRVVDMLHMGYVDEVLFGAEVLERLPSLAREWAERYRKKHCGK